MNKFKTTIGLEVHVQLATKSKMFCRCNNEAFGKAPNTTVCPICLGMPGMLPVANKSAILWTLKTGLALNCQIPPLAKFDRKHYFYPDLPKGYQISQYDQPLCIGGWLKVKSQITNHPSTPLEAGKSQTNSNLEISNNKKIRLNRIHLEEDAGKLIHHHILNIEDKISINNIEESSGRSTYSSKTFVDLNRAGTPLMEIVTEPDLSSPAEAAEFLRKLQKIVRDEIQVSEASMEKGHLRCDANIDLKDGSGNMSEIVEIKNLNSFRFVEKALRFEEKRLQEEHSNWSAQKIKITRGFDSAKGITFEQRTKEQASDYRYFPEPDLPPIDTTKLNIELLKSDISEGEEEKIAKLTEDGISNNDATVLVRSVIKYDTYNKFANLDIPKQYLAKVVINNYFGFEFERSDFQKIDQYQKVLVDFYRNQYPKIIFQKVCKEIQESNLNNEEIYNKLNIESIGKNNKIDKIAEIIIKSHPDKVTRYKSGDKKLIGYFMGELMKETRGMADPATARTVIQNLLDH